MYTATSVATGPAQGSKMRRLDRDVRGEENVCLLSHRTVPNEAGDHRAARTPLGTLAGAHGVVGHTPSLSPYRYS